MNAIAQGPDEITVRIIHIVVVSQVQRDCIRLEDLPGKTVGCQNTCFVQ